MKTLKRNQKKPNRAAFVEDLIEAHGDFISRKDITFKAFGNDPTAGQKRMIGNALLTLKNREKIISWHGSPVTYGLVKWRGQQQSKVAANAPIHRCRAMDVYSVGRAQLKARAKALGATTDSYGFTSLGHNDYTLQNG